MRITEATGGPMTVATPEQETAAAETTAAQRGMNAATRAAQVVLTVVWTIGSLFLGAGTFHWTRGWICVVMWMLLMPLMGLITKHYNPQLMKERAKWRRQDTKRFDKIILPVYLALVLIQPVVGGMDAVRYHWSGMRFAWVYVGVIGFVLASALITWVLSTNPYAEAGVRIQKDRGHTVVTSGLYRFVRHPMNLGMILMYASTPFIWGSLWAFAVSGMMAVLLTVRTALEDQTLRRELPGYEEYAAHTRYRLVPGLW
jgi:protein-S-isoprenylcysteine O-methyltransferase Ste14